MQTTVIEQQENKFLKKKKKDLNVRPQTIKILEENIGSKILDIGHSDILSDITSQARKTNKKTNKQMGPQQTKKFYTTKETIDEIKDNLQNAIYHRYIRYNIATSNVQDFAAYVFI